MTVPCGIRSAVAANPGACGTLTSRVSSSSARVMHNYDCSPHLMTHAGSDWTAWLAHNYPGRRLPGQFSVVSGVAILTGGCVKSRLISVCFLASSQ